MMRYKTLALCCALMGAASAPLAAQSIYGSVAGVVTDNTGAVVVQAKATLVNLANSERRTAVTEESGTYRFPNLYPGDYRLEIEQTGFKTYRREPIRVTIEAGVRIDVALELGAVSDSVVVRAETPLIQSETSSLGQVIQDRHVIEMPLNGRNVLNLVALTPGVVPQGGAQGSPTGKNVFSWGNYQLGGSDANQGSVTLDGAPLNVSYANLTALIPTQDAVQEFKVQTSNLSAEFGRFAGGVINLGSRSGGNAFHGSAYEFLRNKVLNSNTFFNNATGIGRPPFTQNQFGANLGGPIQKDKLFFFTSYEGYRQRTGRSFLLSVPTDKMRGGDFNEAGRTIHDPYSATGAGSLPRKPYPGNVVPRSQFDPVAVKLTDLYARPNLGGIFNNFTTNASAGGGQNQTNNRADYNLGEKHRIFGRWTWWKNDTMALDPFQTKTYFEWGPETTVTNQIVAGDTYLVAPNLIFDLRAGYLRFAYDRMAETAGYDLTTLGWPAFMNTQTSFRHTPYMCVEDYTFFCGNGTGSFIYNRAETYSLNPTMSWVRGKHQLRFGADLRRQIHNYAQTDNSSGSFQFNRAFTADDPFRPTGGFGFASFLLGTAASGASANTGFIASAVFYRALFLADTWQVTRKLTINAGLRFEQPGTFTERYDRLTVLAPNAEHRLAKATGLPLQGTLALVNSPLRPDRSNLNNPTQWAPRFGFAYSLQPSTVLRGGYGIFYPNVDTTLNGNPAWDQINRTSTPMVSTIDGVTPNHTLRNPFPNGLLTPGVRDAETINKFDGLAVSATIPGQTFPYIQQWNFDIQKEVRGLLLDVAYVGSKGTRLMATSQEMNQLPDQYLALGQELVQTVNNPFFGLIATGTLSGRTVQRGQLLRPYPQYTGFGSANNPNRNSIYHAMQLKAEKRFAGGGNILFSYTAGKTISDVSTLTGWVEPTTSTRRCSNNNLRDCRTLNPWDVAQRAVVSYVYDLPVGKGKRLLSGAGGVAGYLVSGWGLNGVITMQSGFPLPITPQLNTSNSFGGNQRVDNIGKSAKTSGAAQGRLDRWFDTSVFRTPQPFTFGNTSTFLPDMRTHGVANWDAAVFKNNRIREQMGIQFRVEFFNILNRVQFSAPNGTLGSPLFGTVRAQANDPRLVQLALRFLF